MSSVVRDRGLGPATVERSISGWGGGPPVPVRVVEPRNAEELEQILGPDLRLAGPGVIARGLGRSYGDAAQLRGGTVIDTRRLKGMTLDQANGTVIAQAGTTIGELLAELVPAGWMLPVVPGTQHVTIGGAIASDIHGKNHAAVGTLGSHVLNLGLLTADGQTRTLGQGPDAELLGTTTGGMGLTGVIVWARIALQPLSSGLMSVDTDRASGLDRVFELLRDSGGSYRVAWLDLLGPRAVRGVVTRAEHQVGCDPGDGVHSIAVPARAAVPERWPGGLLRPGAVRAFNELRYRRAPRSERGRAEPLGRHLFPLDSLASWPRLYGSSGLVQHQCVIPLGQESVVHELIRRVRGGATPCLLAVLKDFGPSAGGPLSFPIEGWTLALDFPRGAPALEPMLDALDDLVVDAGGRVYLTKDARLAPGRIEQMYPRLEEWRAVRDRVDPNGIWRSDLALRTGLLGPR